jgi:hypothetical protein
VRRLLALLLASAALLAACGGDSGGDSGGSGDTATVSSSAAPEGIEGVIAFDIEDNSHVEGSVDYGQSPPVGGPHNQVWANCKFYEEEIPNENVVHSLEHGAVWITFTSDADTATLDTIRAIVDTSDHLIASLYPDQDSPIVLTAWNRQLALDSIEDPRVQAFVETYLLADTAPEPGASCSGGAG